jgi:DNA repair photolyase
MALKKPTGDMYSFVDWIWNPVRGRCFHDCAYCYVKRIARRFSLEQRPPHLVKFEMGTNLGRGNKIFVCSGCDLFARDVPFEYICDVVDHTLSYPENAYIFQTKNPQRIVLSSFRLSASLHKICTTLETNRWVPLVMRNAPTPALRAQAMAVLANRGFKTMVTIEPIMDFDIDKLLLLVYMTRAEQVNIGAKSGGHTGFPEPAAEKVRYLITELNAFTRVEVKTNLGRLL